MWHSDITVQCPITLISACGRAPPDRIFTYNRSRAGSMFHRCEIISNIGPEPLPCIPSVLSEPLTWRTDIWMKSQLFPHYYKPNHLTRIEALGRVYAYLPREKGWVSNLVVFSLSPPVAVSVHGYCFIQFSALCQRCFRQLLAYYI